jgi:squalene-hopene/tetraprenyl-beta-curcumene cyclase
MQCRNGGWGSFDKDNTKMIFQYIPFADHNAMLDPPTVDITGRILEMLASYGYTRGDKRVEKAIKFIFKRAGAGRKLVRPLGRQLHLRHLPGAARS